MILYFSVTRMCIFSPSARPFRQSLLRFLWLGLMIDFIPARAPNRPHFTVNDSDAGTGFTLSSMQLSALRSFEWFGFIYWFLIRSSRGCSLSVIWFRTIAAFLMLIYNNAWLLKYVELNTWLLLAACGGLFCFLIAYRVRLGGLFYRSSTLYLQIHRCSWSHHRRNIFTSLYDLIDLEAWHKFGFLLMLALSPEISWCYHSYKGQSGTDTRTLRINTWFMKT